MSDLWDHRYTEEDAKVIKRIAWSVLGHYGYRVTDIEDLQQDLAEHVWQKTHRFTPKRGKRRAFITTVAKNKLLNLIEERTAIKRDSRRNVSIEATGDGILIDGSASPDRLQIQMDTREAIKDMPDELRRVAELRMHHSEKELESLLGLSRGKVRSRLRRIGAFLRERGLAPDDEDE